MKGNLRHFFLTITILFAVSMPLYAAEKFTLDPQHSYVLWKINHFGFSSQSGKWFVNGFVTLDKDNPQNSKVEATINVANLITGIPELDRHLKGKLFFDADLYPTATFVSDKVDVINNSSAKVHGILTLHGISKPIILMVALNKVGKNPISDRMTIGFAATTELNRSDFGIKTLLPEVSDQVTIEIAAEAYQAQP